MRMERERKKKVETEKEKGIERYLYFYSSTWVYTDWFENELLGRDGWRGEQRQTYYVGDIIVVMVVVISKSVIVLDCDTDFYPSFSILFLIFHIFIFSYFHILFLYFYLWKTRLELQGLNLGWHLMMPLKKWVAGPLPIRASRYISFHLAEK